MTSNEHQRIDTYAILEFQGIVTQAPEYDPKTQTLAFYARPYGKPSLRFVARGNLGSAFKSLLFLGRAVQLTAHPVPYIKKVGRTKKYTVIEWECKTITVLGNSRIKLRRYLDAIVLDGLMPRRYEIYDVGHVDEEDIKEEREDDADLL